jgi:hypothetical protein
MSQWPLPEPSLDPILPVAEWWCRVCGSYYVQRYCVLCETDELEEA